MMACQTGFWKIDKTKFLGCKEWSEGYFPAYIDLLFFITEIISLTLHEEFLYDCSQNINCNPHCEIEAHFFKLRHIYEI